MEDDKIIITMRYMEWQRLKGMIESIKGSYWNDKAYDEFKKVDDNGLCD
jgi:hypothetical protein